MKEKLPEPLHTAIKVIFAQVDLLRAKYPGKRFTPGDKLIGDTGEVLAEHLFNLVPLKSNTKDHDYQCPKKEKMVQVKITGQNRLGLGLEKTEFEHLLAFKFYPDGTFEIIYNGGGNRVAQHIQNNKSSSIQVSALRELNKQVLAGEALPRKSV